MSDLLPQPPAGPPNIVLYHTSDGRNHIQVQLDAGTVWLTQQQLAELFETSKQNISLHLKNIFKEGELDTKRVVKEYLTTAADGKKYKTKFFNLEAILAVGYRVRSTRGVQFRQWATERLKEYVIKGFVLDDQRLKGQDRLNDHFDELLDRIREIRASEKRVYQRIRDIFSLAADYVDGNINLSELGKINKSRNGGVLTVMTVGRRSLRHYAGVPAPLPAFASRFLNKSNAQAFQLTNHCFAQKRPFRPGSQFCSKG